MDKFRTPYFLIDAQAIESNLAILAHVQRESGCKILLAQKAFSTYALYPNISAVLQGTTASGLYEAKLGSEEFGKETHVYSPAYRADEFDEILGYADHIVFNSCAQLNMYGALAKQKKRQIALRVNPECSTQNGHALYDPCAPFSRLGCTRAELDMSLVGMLDGLHMHTLCEQNADDLLTTVCALEEKFGEILACIQWLNLGGGHLITRPDYDVNLLIKIITNLRAKYNIDVYLEPGEAVVLNAGTLVASVLDFVYNCMDIAILDTSAACHMPDVLEMPYRPNVIGAGELGEKKHTYRLAGGTCLAGDVIGDYSFDAPLKIGDQVKFLDMALYTMVKTNTFNGMALPSIVVKQTNGKQTLVNSFGYEDFKRRL